MKTKLKWKKVTIAILSDISENPYPIGYCLRNGDLPYSFWFAQDREFLFLIEPYGGEEDGDFFLNMYYFEEGEDSDIIHCGRSCGNLSVAKKKMQRLVDFLKEEAWA